MGGARQQRPEREPEKLDAEFLAHDRCPDGPAPLAQRATPYFGNRLNDYRVAGRWRRRPRPCLP